MGVEWGDGYETGIRHVMEINIPGTFKVQGLSDFFRRALRQKPDSTQVRYMSPCDVPYCSRRIVQMQSYRTVTRVFIVGTAPLVDHDQFLDVSELV
jgi:hypothetical protein